MRSDSVTLEMSVHQEIDVLMHFVPVQDFNLFLDHQSHHIDVILDTLFLHS